MAFVSGRGRREPDRQSAARSALLRHDTFPYRTLFAAHIFSGTDLPWAYLPTYNRPRSAERVLCWPPPAPIGGRVVL